MLWRNENLKLTATVTWRRFAALFLGVFFGGLAGLYAFVLLVDPYGVVPFSLPIERRIVSINQRHMYPQMVQSGRFDSIVLGTSTSRLLDPEQLNGLFGARFFNAAMNNGRAWEQKLIFDKFVDKVPAPKVVIVGLDTVWCQSNAASHRFGYPDFPHWMYDANPGNDFLHLLNAKTVEHAGQLVATWVGIIRDRVRGDGFEVFVPPEEIYDADRARHRVWDEDGRPRPRELAGPPVAWSAERRSSLRLPALAWLDDMLARLPPATLKVLAYMPVHVAVQPLPGSSGAEVEAECKDRIETIARRRDARVVDWRIPSRLTRDESNYWDALHFRLPVARRVARDLAAAVLEGREAADGSYRLMR